MIALLLMIPLLIAFSGIASILFVRVIANPIFILIFGTFLLGGTVGIILFVISLILYFKRMKKANVK